MFISSAPFSLCMQLIICGQSLLTLICSLQKNCSAFVKFVYYGLLLFHFRRNALSCQSVSIFRRQKDDKSVASARLVFCVSSFSVFRQQQTYLNITDFGTRIVTICCIYLYYINNLQSYIYTHN